MYCGVNYFWFKTPFFHNFKKILKTKLKLITGATWSCQGGGYSWWKCQLMWETICQKLIRFEIDKPAISFLGIHPRDDFA